jgi:hypothetical protein
MDPLAGVTRSTKRLWIVIVSLICASTAHAIYDSNLSGTVTAVLTYPNGMLLFTLANQPTSHGSCTATLFFELDVSDAVSDVAFSRMYAAERSQSRPTALPVTVLVSERLCY